MWHYFQSDASADVAAAGRHLAGDDKWRLGNYLAKSSWLQLIVVLLLLQLSGAVLGADILLIHARDESIKDMNRIEAAVSLRGLNLVRRTTDSAQEVLQESKVKGVIVAPGVYRRKNWENSQRNLLNAIKASPLPVLFVGLNGALSSDVERSADQVGVVDGLLLQNIPDISQQTCVYSVEGNFEPSLSGFEFPCSELPNGSRQYFVFNAETIQPVISMQTRPNGDLWGSARRYPVFVKSRMGSRDVFFLADGLEYKESVRDVARWMWNDFGVAGAIVMFAGHVAGENGWEMEDGYANLTIDDPWLHEPYGNFSYASVLAAMKKHDFHTTIAFVPWNFDRNDPEVAELIKKNQQYFSLSLHGNNHDHEEFSDSRSVSAAEQSIVQGLARMNVMKERLALPFDPVMVFPQRVSRQEVVALLRRHRFSCTANIQNSRETAPVMPLHPWSGFVDFREGVPSLKREAANEAAAYFALLRYLQRPVLIHTHQEYFADNDFTRVADTLNALPGGNRWLGLGSICEKLYLRKLDSDGQYSVLLYGTRTVLTNPSENRKVFRVKKPMAVDIASVQVGGVPAEFSKTSDSVEFEVVLDGKASAVVQVGFAGEVTLPGGVDTGKGEVRFAMLRYASDFRDMFISRFELGRKLNANYYSAMRGYYGYIDHVAFGIVFVLFVAIGWRVMFVIRGRLKLKSSAA